MKTYYVTIGNSDDKLSQRQWCKFGTKVGDAILQCSLEMYGAWTSPSLSPYQNACWSFSLDDLSVPMLKGMLNDLRILFGQDTIAWAEAEVTFIGEVEQPVVIAYLAGSVYRHQDCGGLVAQGGGGDYRCARCSVSGPLVDAPAMKDQP